MYLEHIDPAKLKAMGYEELEALCAEIRARLIATVTERGGHLASNLGAVELTVALHRAFDCPKDKLVFDVGHQAYVHKLLTGRNDRFGTLRTLGGLSGFPSREESEYDAFGGGHSSTSISAALGMARARDLRGGKEYVAAVIGDGALTGGMAYEALNDAGHTQTPLIVVLNDNEMSIAKNVGALNKSLARLRTKSGYLKLKSGISGRWPRLKAVLAHVRNNLKYLILPNTFFEELGFKYFGPVNGHDLRALDEAFCRVKRLERPVLVHVCTQKGRGYVLAEQNPEQFHGVAPFFSEAKGKKENGKSNSEVFGEALSLLAERDERIVALTAAMPKGTGLSGFLQRFPSRFFDVGIAEQHAVTLAAGLAAGGMKPCFAVYSAFLQRAVDQLFTDVCLQRLPVVFAVDRCGPVGEDGPTHHGGFDIAYLTAMPNLAVASPASQKELQKLLELGFACGRPFALRYGRGSLPEGEEAPVEFGRWQKVREGADLALVATGRMVQAAVEAAGLLQKEQGREAAVYNARFLKPMDAGALKELAGYPLVAAVEDEYPAGGLGEHLARALPGLPVHCFALPEKPLPAAAFEEQMALAGLTPEGLYKQITALWEEG